MIPTDPDTVAAWQEYELRNAAANAEYRHRQEGRCTTAASRQR